MPPRTRLQRCWSLFYLGVIVLFITGCARMSVYRDPAFHGGQIANEGIGIAGVTGLGGGEHPLAGRIEEALIKNLQETMAVSLLPSSELKPLLAGEAYQRFLTDFSELPEIRPGDFEVLAPAGQRVRFVLLAHVGKDIARQSEDLSETIHTTRVKNKQTGKYEDQYDYTEYKTSRHASRDVGMHFLICDLDRGKVVWSSYGAEDCTASASTANDRWRSAPPPWPGTPGNVPLMDVLVERMARTLQATSMQPGKVSP